MSDEKDTLEEELAAERAAHDGDADDLSDDDLSHEVDKLPGEDDDTDND